MTTRPRLRHWWLPSFLVVAAAVLVPALATAQDPAAGDGESPPGLVRVYLDCSLCDEIYLRQNVTFLEYVRDRAVAEVHVLVTSEPTGGGGTLWTVNFIGLGRFDGQNRILSFPTLLAATSDERRSELARIFQLGMLAYALESPAAPNLSIRWNEPDEDDEEPARDPWNYWVFRINGNGSSNGQRTRTNNSYRLSGSASRTTDTWKVNLSGGRTINTQSFEVAGTKVDSERRSWNIDGLVVRSLTGRWSLGGRLKVEHSSFNNTDLAVTMAPGIEFDFFPYSESSRRSLTIQYSVGATRLEYRDLTVFDKLEETVPHHALIGSLGLRQPWGSLGANASLSQHLDHRDRRRLSVGGDANVRLVKGLSFNVFGSYDKISDQITLRKGSATTEEVLLSLQQLETDYSYFVSFGVSYSFGSIFNSTVNPRLNGSGALSF